MTVQSTWTTVIMRSKPFHSTQTATKDSYTFFFLPFFGFWCLLLPWCFAIQRFVFAVLCKNLSIVMCMCVIFFFFVMCRFTKGFFSRYFGVYLLVTTNFSFGETFGFGFWVGLRLLIAKRFNIVWREKKWNKIFHLLPTAVRIVPFRISE